MYADDYQKLAMVTASLPTEPRTFSPTEQLLLCSGLALPGESGEVSDMLKKHFFHGHPLDKDALLKELGDVAWYLALAAHALDTNLSTILDMNIEKLKRRYPNGFTQHDSLNRAE